jgi:hypothetical protein
MRQCKKLELTAVFWDLPKFLDENYLRHFLSDQKGKPPYDWAMTRFLIYGRIIDALSIFTIKEISENLDKLQIPAHSLKIWKRMVEVYG